MYKLHTELLCIRFPWVKNNIPSQQHPNLKIVQRHCDPCRISTYLDTRRLNDKVQYPAGRSSIGVVLRSWRSATAGPPPPLLPPPPPPPLISLKVRSGRAGGPKEFKGVIDRKRLQESPLILRYCSKISLKIYSQWLCECR